MWHVGHRVPPKYPRRGPHRRAVPGQSLPENACARWREIDYIQINSFIAVLCDLLNALKPNFQGSSRYTFFVLYRWLWFPRTTGTNGSRLLWFHVIAVGAWMVPEKLGLLRSGLRSLVKSARWLRCGLRFQVKSAGRFRSGLHSTSFVPNCDISHAFNFRHAFTATYRLLFISTATVSPAAAFCADCTSWRHWLRLSCCAAMTALYF